MRIAIQNLIVIALGYEGQITDTSYLEYKDYDDYISESFHAKLLDNYIDYSIGDIFKLSSEEFIDLSPDIMSVYVEKAREHKERETRELEEAQAALDNAAVKEKETLPNEPELHPAQQMRKDAQQQQTKK